MTGRDAGQQAEGHIRAVLEQMQQAIHDRNAKRYFSHFEPGAIEFDLAPPLGHVIDADGLSKWLMGWDGPVVETTRDFRVEVGGDMAFAYGMTHVAVARGGQDISWWMRRTTCLRRTSQGWKVVHDHTSVPFHMDGSLKAAVDLEP